MKYAKFAAMGLFIFQGLKNELETAVINEPPSVRATEVLLYNEECIISALMEASGKRRSAVVQKSEVVVEPTSD